MNNPNKHSKRLTYVATDNGIELANKKFEMSDFLTKQAFADHIQISRSTLYKFFKQDPISLDCFISICEGLNEPCWQKIAYSEVEIDSETKIEQSVSDIEWRTIFKKYLANSYIHKNSRYDDSGISIGLSLKKRKGYKYCSLDEQIPIDIVYINDIDNHIKYDDFISNVIFDKDQKKSKKRISIIGEPGSGKTTLLKKLSNTIINKYSCLSIYINLGSVSRNISLNNYIKSEWLENALNSSNFKINNSIEKVFSDLFDKEEIWILLDGLDEQKGQSSADLLSWITKEIEEEKGLLRKAHIILSCRVNVWDYNPIIIPPKLNNFIVYKTVGFSNSQQVSFINKYFEQNCENNIFLQERLVNYLEEKGQERIRDLFRNPLYLYLLCKIYFERGLDKLPKTIVNLYESYLECFYGSLSKIKNIYDDSPHDLYDLDKDLSKLALKALENKSRYLMTKEFIIKTVKQSNYSLIITDGLLNIVDIDINNKQIYAFFHPTFQEFFAAKEIISLIENAIDDHNKSEYKLGYVYYQVSIFARNMVTDNIFKKSLEILIESKYSKDIKNYAGTLISTNFNKYGKENCENYKNKLLKCWQDYYNISQSSDYNDSFIEETIWFNGEIAIILGKLENAEVILQYIDIQLKHDKAWNYTLKLLLTYYENNFKLLIQGLLRNLSFEELDDIKIPYHWSFRILAVFRLGKISNLSKDQDWFYKKYLDKECIHLLKKDAKSAIEKFLKTEKEKLKIFNPSKYADRETFSFSHFAPKDGDMIKAVNTCLNEIKLLN